MQIEENVSLKSLNTLHLNSVSKYYIVLKSRQEIPDVIDYVKKNKLNFFVLGGGSNIILPEFYDGLTIKNEIKGVSKLKEDDSFYYIKVGAGEIWDDFVGYSVINKYYGLENLSLIPGSVGASVIQNIGAYGSEVKDCVDCVEIYDTKNNTYEIFSFKDCKFRYRNSIFKDELNRYVVISITFKLLKKENLNLSYKDIKKVITDPKLCNSMELRNCVINIRKNKLPDFNIIGNVGSFFHNPIIDKSFLDELLLKYPNIPFFKDSEDKFKVSAGWLIENIGLKGYRKNNVGTYDKQALVLVNYADATKTEILDFANYIIDKVKTVYNIRLNIEPIII